MDIKACRNFEFKKCLGINDKIDTKPYKKELKDLEAQVCKSSKEKCLTEGYTDFSVLNLTLTAKEGNLLAYFLFGTGNVDKKNLPKTKEGKIDMSKPIKINFGQNLVELWEKKLKNSNGVTKKFFEEDILPYLDGKRKFSKTNIKGYMSDIRNGIDDVKKGLNQNGGWEKIKDIYNIPDERFNLFKKICLSINEKDILSYGLTELMPSKDGEQNIDIFEFLLKNAGKEYIEHIPALFDTKTSFGLYQFTEYALFDTGKEKRGASRVNQALPKELKIPGSVIKLDGKSQHKAAYMFGIDNLATLFRKLSDKEFKVLEKLWSSKQQETKEDLIQFIATAHHLPGNAMYSAKRWLDNGGKLDYSRSTDSRILGYTIKTKSNLEAIKNLK